MFLQIIAAAGILNTDFLHIHWKIGKKKKKEELYRESGSDSVIPQLWAKNAWIPQLVRWTVAAVESSSEYTEQ